MFDIIKKELNISILSSIIYIILGIIIVLNPEEALEGMSIVIAALLIAFGIMFIVINFKYLKRDGNILCGILLIVMGIALAIYPKSLNVLISLGVGTWFIAVSISRIKVATWLREITEVNWLMILIPAIFTLLIGIVFIFAPLTSAVTLAIITGSLMIVYSLCDLFEVLYIKKNIRSVQKALNKNA